MAAIATAMEKEKVCQYCPIFTPDDYDFYLKSY